MIVSVKAIEAAGLIGKWVAVSPQEIAAIEENIPLENLQRSSSGTSRTNYRHYVRDGHICVTEQECEAHPSDLPKA
jgi:hypothetical protein